MKSKGEGMSMRRQVSILGQSYGVRYWDGFKSIVGLHGFSGSADDFEAIAPHLDFGVEALDLIGHGETATPCELSHYTIDEQVKAVSSVLNPPRMVLGYSMGGRLALQLAHMSPDRVEGVILIGATPGIEDPKQRQERVSADEALADRIESAGISTFADEWESRPVIASQRHIKSPFGQRLRSRRRDNSALGLANSLRGMGTGVMPSLWDVLHTIRIPTLLVTGAQDHKFTAINIAMAQAMPSAHHHIIDNAGHCAHLEQPVAVATLINGFVAAL